MAGKKTGAEPQKDAAKDRALDSILGQIERQYGLVQERLA